MPSDAAFTCDYTFALKNHENAHQLQQNAKANKLTPELDYENERRMNERNREQQNRSRNKRKIVVLFNMSLARDSLHIVRIESARKNGIGRCRNASVESLLYHVFFIIFVIGTLL